MDAPKAKQNMSNSHPDGLTAGDVFGNLQIRSQDDFFCDTHVVVRKEQAQIAIDGSLVFLNHGRVGANLFPNVFKALDEPLQILCHCFASIDFLLAQYEGRL